MLPPTSPAVADGSAPFCRQRRRQLHARAQAGFAYAGFLHNAMIAETRARVEALGRTFARVLDIGGPAPAWAGAVRMALAPGMGVQIVADEDRLPFADSSFDLVISIAGLASVSDLPGALWQARRVLAPDGLFVGCFAGGLTLGELREDLIRAESSLTDRVAPRLAPMVDAQAAAGLLGRAGFAMPVADIERVQIRYHDLAGLIADLSAMGARSPLAARLPLRRDVLADAARRFAARGDVADGKVAVTVDLVHLAGWAPGAQSGLESPLAQAISRAI